VAMLLLFSNFTWAQRVLSGKVTDSEGPVAGATVLIKGTSSATATDGEGNFSLSTDLRAGEIIIRILSFTSKTIPFSSQTNLGTIILTTSDSQSLEEVVVVGRGIIDIAEDRKTPIAVSTVSRAEILERGVGNVEFPEIMKNIP